MDELFVIIAFFIYFSWYVFVCCRFRPPSQQNTRNRAPCTQRNVFTTIVVQLLLAVQPVVFLCMLQAYMLLHVTTCYYVLLHVTTCYYVLLRVTTYTTLTLSITTQVYFNRALHVCYMVGPSVRPSPGVSIQKTSTGRYILSSVRWFLMILI